jgi:MraZ protein
MGEEVREMYGQYRHTLDAKCRVFIPAKFREELGERFYMAKSVDPCLTLYPEGEWQRILERFNSLSPADRRKMRYFFANVCQCEPDKQGRILLPEAFRAHAGVSQEVLFLGQAGYAEIWAADRYEEEEQQFYASPEGVAMVEELGF